MKKKICLIIPTLKSGGMERVISELANHFCENDLLQVHLILLSKCPHFYKIDARVFIYEPTSNTRHSFLGFWKWMNYVKYTVRKIRPDTILSFGEIYNSFILIVLLFSKQKIFISDRCRPDKDWGVVYNFLRRILYPFASGIVAQTEFSKLYSERKRLNENIEVIANPIKKFKKIEDIKNENIILSCGRLIKSKRFDVLLEIFNQVKNEKWQLIILGDGPEYNNLIEKINHLGLNNYVVMAGNQQNIELFYNKAKIFAFTSNSEGFPNVLGEAMLAGLAPITFRFISGAEDLIDNKMNGFLFEMDDVEGYIKQLKLLMDSDELVDKISKNAQIKAASFDIKIIANKYLNFITK